MEKIIWTMWWQGEKKAPPIVKACIESMRKYGNGASVHVIEEGNYRSYIDLPEFLTEKFEKNRFSITHFSDILRMRLIEKYGGLWIDSTVLLTEDICEEIWRMDFYTIKRRIDAARASGNVSKGRWTAFLLGGCKGHIMFREMDRVFCNYWRREEELLTYFLIDYFLDILYEQCDAVRKPMDELPYSQDKIFELEKKMNDRYVPDLPKSIGHWHKLSWKKEYNLTTMGESTVYGEILHFYHLNSDCEKSKKKQEKARKSRSASKMDQVKTVMTKSRLSAYGIMVCAWSALSLFTMNRQGKLFRVFDRKHDKVIKRYLIQYYKEQV